MRWVVRGPGAASYLQKTRIPARGLKPGNVTNPPRRPGMSLQKTKIPARGSKLGWIYRTRGCGMIPHTERMCVTLWRKLCDSSPSSGTSSVSWDCSLHASGVVRHLPNHRRYRWGTRKHQHHWPPHVRHQPNGNQQRPLLLLIPPHLRGSRLRLYLRRRWVLRFHRPEHRFHRPEHRFHRPEHRLRPQRSAQRLSPRSPLPMPHRFRATFPCQRSIRTSCR